MPTLTINTFNPGTAFGSDVGLLATADGKRMVDLWNEVIVPSLNDYNAVKTGLVDFFGYRDGKLLDQVVQTVGRRWQKNTEVNKGIGGAKIRRWIIRTALNEFKTYSGYTRKYIQENTAAAMVNEFNAMLKALTDQKFVEVLTAIFSGVERDVIDLSTHEALKIQTLVNGTGNMPIPPVGTNTWDSTHSHYLFCDNGSTAPWKTSTDARHAQVKALLRTVSEHKYRKNLVLICQGDVMDDIQGLPGFRPFRSFSPLGASEQAALGIGELQANITTFKELGMFIRVVGTLDNATVLESEMMPVGYLMAFSFEGLNSEDNPVQWIENPITTFSDNPFPFYENLYETSFGASIRKRLNGAVLYLANGANAYVSPTLVDAGAMVGDWDGN